MGTLSKGMDILTEKLQDVLMPVADVLNRNIHLTALKEGMMMTIPITIIGGVFCLLANPPIPQDLQATNFFFQFLLSWRDWANANMALLIPPYSLTIGFIAVYTVLGVTYRLSKAYKIDTLSTLAVAVFIFFVTAGAPFPTENFGDVVSMGNLGGTGMFYAIIVAFAVCEIVRFFQNKNIKIRLPESVPPAVSAPFEALIPSAFAVILFIVFNMFCKNVFGTDACNLVYTVIQPFLYASTSLPSVILFSCLLSLFWFMGIHANNLVGAILNPITTANFALNAQVLITGEGTMTPLAGSFMTVFGNWMSYPAMVLCFFLVAKSAHLKNIRKLALLPDLFNINEPLTFGLPIVMNVLLALPIMICNIIMCSAAYIIMNLGWVKCISISVPWTCPAVINLFLSTGDYKNIIMWLIMFVIDVFIMLPFVKMYDNQLLKEEKNVVKQQ